MRIAPFLISATITVGLVFVCNHRWTIGGNKTPRFGNFVSPQRGFWQNAEASNSSFNLNLKSTLLQDKVEVFLDDRLVPHVFAQNEHDVYFAQGYLHAKFRLWQLEFQTHAAAGRLAELIGRNRGNYSILDNRDRYFRRLGMGWAAENSLKQAEANPDSKMVMDAYRDGINLYIENLQPEDYPIEYKLLDYAPEKWTNLKTALFLKYMSYDLAGYEEDFEKTNLKSILSFDGFNKAFPYGQDSLDPIIPKGTVYPTPAISLKIPATADSLYFNFRSDSLPINGTKPNPDNGSNNWAVAGSKTASGKPILCGDPHLGLNLPSLWYEIQLHTPQWNAYGVSFPGAPAIPIGFNDSIAWSETNAERDVRDYYEITFKDATQKEYLFNGQWKQTTWRIDTIKVRGEADFIDSVPYTLHGPVMFEKRYANQLKNNKAYAVRWKAHDASNEGWTFIKLARAKNYTDYVEAIKTFECPGQNFVFASKSGDVAMWCQGAFPAKWKRQGTFLMPGADSTYMWQAIIPNNENPHMLNPERGFVSSANQLPVEPDKYAYYLGGNFELYRGITINKALSSMSNITPQMMEALQNNNYNAYAASALPLLLKKLNQASLSATELEYYNLLKQWNFKADPAEKAAIISLLFLQYFQQNIWADEIASPLQLAIKFPQKATAIEGILKDSNFAFIDNINTPQKETLKDIAMAAFKSAAKEVDSIKQTNPQLNWATYKATQVAHLMKLAAFSNHHVQNGGGTNIINATTNDHGPSWRMVVHLNTVTEAYGVYPGGQNGNPGSRFYDNFINTWAAGNYYPLWIMNDADTKDAKDAKVKWKIEITKG